MPLRLYEGINLNTIKDASTRTALKAVDDFLRSLYDSQAALNLSSVVPNPVTVLGPAAAGESSALARADHAHVLTPFWVRKTADQAVTAVGYGSDVDVTDLAFAVEAGISYSFMFEILLTTNATTTGPRLSINGPAASAVNYGFIYPVDAGVAGAQVRYAGLASGYDAGELTTAGGAGLARLVGSVTTTAAGTLTLRANTETGTTTILAGSFGVLFAHP